MSYLNPIACELVLVFGGLAACRKRSFLAAKGLVICAIYVHACLSWISWVWMLDNLACNRALLPRVLSCHLALASDQQKDLRKSTSGAGGQENLGGEFCWLLTFTGLLCTAHSFVTQK